jgi:hypothetical protein
MPEDYQSLLADLGVDTSAQPAPVQQPTDPQPTSEPSAEPAADPAPVAEPEAAPADDNADEQRRANEAFAAMRAENSKYKKFMQHIMKGANFQGDEAAFMEALTDASYKRQAANQGNQVSPEILKRMDTLESQNNSLLEARNRELFAANLKNMQTSLSLSDKDVKEFVDYALKEKIDLTIPGTNFVTLYRGLFYDKLMSRTVEDERQKWITQSNKANNATNPDGKSGKQDPVSTNVNTMAEFDSLLQSIPTNKK